MDWIHRWETPSQDGLPTLLLLHGTGGNEHDLIDLGRALLPGAGLLSPRGPVLERGMPRFFRRLAEGVFDLEDLHARTDQLAALIGEAARTYGFDAGRVIAAGFSNGANIAASLLFQRPGTLAGAVLLAPMVPFVPETAPDLSGVPVFLGAGRQDPLVPPAETERLAGLLQGYHASVTLHWHSGGHQLTADTVRAAREWMQTHGIQPVGDRLQEQL